MSSLFDKFYVFMTDMNATSLSYLAAEVSVHYRHSKSTCFQQLSSIMCTMTSIPLISLASRFEISSFIYVKLLNLSAQNLHNNLMLQLQC